MRKRDGSFELLPTTVYAVTGENGIVPIAISLATPTMKPKPTKDKADHVLVQPLVSVTDEPTFGL